MLMQQTPIHSSIAMGDSRANLWHASPFTTLQGGKVTTKHVNDTPSESRPLSDSNS